ncbi:GH23051 [Drosophila grimshawi]|uniref:GH23051 n=1 Tax=Drosophila grimshawi TaxID=7222 RepID=B4JWJ0_DROGR|nr:GH23051 [Drosophila grimshawi]
MNMNYNNNIPYEANYNDEMMGMQQMGMQGASQGLMPMNMPMSMPAPTGMPPNQMQLPMGNNMAPMMPMPAGGQMCAQPMQRTMMQSQPMAMMPAMQAMQGMPQMQPTQTNQVSMSMSQLPPGAVTPLSSVSVMPLMGGGAGAIDGGGMNVVVPGLQPMSAMTSQLNANNQGQHMHHGRMAGGDSADGQSNWNAANQMMPNNMWNYAQVYPNVQQQPQQQHHQQQQFFQHLQQQEMQNQQQQQQQRMKSNYNYGGNNNNYREAARNGLK